MTSEEGGQRIPLTHIAQLLAVQQYTRHPTPQTHMAGRREGVTHLPLGVTMYALLNSIVHEVNQFKKQKHTCKKVIHTLPNLKHNKQSSPTTQTTTWKGGG